MTEEKRTYSAIYTCTNCGTEKRVDVRWGKFMPVFTEHLTTIDECLGLQESPECDYCGCRDWSHGKKPQDC